MGKCLSILPRCVKIQLAADYVGLSISGFRSAVRRGLLPGPMRDPVTGNKTGLYDLVAIDLAINRLSGITQTENGPSPLEMWKASRNAAKSQARPGH